MMGEYSESQRAAVRRLRWLSQYCGENKNVEVVDDVERVQAQIAEVVVDSVDRFLRRDGRLPRPVWRTAGSELSDNHQPLRIRICLATFAHLWKPFLWPRAHTIPLMLVPTRRTLPIA
jgi:hypothetical protein